MTELVARQEATSETTSSAFELNLVNSGEPVKILNKGATAFHLGVWAVASLYNWRQENSLVGVSPGERGQGPETVAGGNRKEGDIQVIKSRTQSFPRPSVGRGPGGSLRKRGKLQCRGRGHGRLHGHRNLGAEQVLSPACRWDGSESTSSHTMTAPCPHALPLHFSFYSRSLWTFVKI